MKTSRTEGILILETKNPYKAAVDGKLEERNDIICYDVISKIENTALDLEQKLSLAFTSLPEGKSSLSKKEVTLQEKAEKDFYKNDSPTDEEIKEQSDSMKMAVQFNDKVKLSELMDMFIDFINAGRVCYAGGEKLTKPIWESIDRKDKVDIMFMYCAFFVNPLEALQNMA